MSPLQLAIRFGLEISALVAIGAWARHAAPSGVVGWLAAVASVVVVAATWGTFAVPEDPSRSGKAPVAVAGWIRLAIELAVFASGAAALAALGFRRLFIAYCVVVAFHHVGSTRRLVWLVRQ